MVRRRGRKQRGPGRRRWGRRLQLRWPRRPSDRGHSSPKPAAVGGHQLGGVYERDDQHDNHASPGERGPHDDDHDGAAAPAMMASSLATASKGYVRVELSCERAACSGAAEVTQQIPSKEQESSSATNSETVVLARGAFHIAPGRRAAIELKETTVGAALFAGADNAHRVRVRLVVAVRGGVGVTGMLAIA